MMTNPDSMRRRDLPLADVGKRKSCNMRKVLLFLHFLMKVLNISILGCSPYVDWAFIEEFLFSF